ncbi:hypothetical protein AAE478_003261 [Parahypoxylon ruwenzoriense]
MEVYDLAAAYRQARQRLGYVNLSTWVLIAGSCLFAALLVGIRNGENREGDSNPEPDDDILRSFVGGKKRKKAKCIT